MRRVDHQTPHQGMRVSENSPEPFEAAPSTPIRRVNPHSGFCSASGHENPRSVPKIGEAQRLIEEPEEHMAVGVASPPLREKREENQERHLERAGRDKKIMSGLHITTTKKNGIFTTHDDVRVPQSKPNESITTKRDR